MNAFWADRIDVCIVISLNLIQCCVGCEARERERCIPGRAQGRQAGCESCSDSRAASVDDLELSERRDEESQCSRFIIWLAWGPNDLQDALRSLTGSHTWIAALHPYRRHHCDHVLVFHDPSVYSIARAAGSPHWTFSALSYCAGEYFSLSLTARVPPRHQRWRILSEGGDWSRILIFV